jgi:hypothetical protein
MNIDNDYQWLQSHLKGVVGLKPRQELASKVSGFLRRRIDSGGLPYTVGVFGGWGAGKTTFLALLAERLEKTPNCRIIYFNSWKYAGFMEIVPSLIYKILRYGAVNTESGAKAAMRVLLSLGREYSDAFGEWAKGRTGVDPVHLFKQVYGEVAKLESEDKFVSAQVLEAYYTQVDRAQDLLKEVLGVVEEGKAPASTVIVLIDELDRCDPDEAFTVIKQMRVLFSMRNLPVAFVVCANPEPIGLAIKHRYGLESAAGDYEARRILEKFVDSYEDLSESLPLAPLVHSIWKDRFREHQPWVLAWDAAGDTPDFEEDTIGHSTGFDAMTTAVPLYSNLRVLLKSFRYVDERSDVNRHLLWSTWHLEIASEIEPHFRADLRALAGTIEDIAFNAYEALASVQFTVEAEARKPRLKYSGDKGQTLFAIFRSCFWDYANTALDELDKDRKPESQEGARALRALLRDPRRVDFVILLCLVPFNSALGLTEGLRHGATKLPALHQEFSEGLQHELGNLLASY